MNSKKTLVRAFALLGCFAVTGFVVTGCGKKDDAEDTTTPAKKPAGGTDKGTEPTK